MKPAARELDPLLCEKHGGLGDVAALGQLIMRGQPSCGRVSTGRPLTVEAMGSAYVDYDRRMPGSKRLAATSHDDFGQADMKARGAYRRRLQSVSNALLMAATGGTSLSDYMPPRSPGSVQSAPNLQELGAR